MDIETAVHPPEPEVDEDGRLPSTRLMVSLLNVDDEHYEAAVQLFGADAGEPEKFASALLRAALALGALLGPEYHWAATRRFAAYDGTSGR